MFIQVDSASLLLPFYSQGDHIPDLILSGQWYGYYSNVLIIIYFFS